MALVIILVSSHGYRLTYPHISNEGFSYSPPDGPCFFQALDQGLLGMAFTNGSPYVAPTRSNIAQNCCENPNQNVACTKNDKPDTNVTMIVKMRISGVQPHCSQPYPYLWLRQDLTETTCCLIWSDIDNNVSIVIS